MKITKRIAPALAAIVLALGAAPASAQEAQVPTVQAAPDGLVAISKVRIVVEETVYEWSDPDSFPEKEGDLSSCRTVASFLGFAPGQRLRPEELDLLAALAAKRLMESGYYFDAQAAVLPARLYPERRTVLVTVKEGFRWRFGGGSIFAMAGQENFRGERKSWAAVLGWNADALSYADGLAFGLPLELGASIRYGNCLDGRFADYHEAGAALSARYRPHPDLSLGAGVDAAYRDYLDSSSASLSAFSAEDGVDALASIGLEFSPVLPYEGASLDLSAKAGAVLAAGTEAFPFLGKASAALSLGAGPFRARLRLEGSWSRAEGLGLPLRLLSSLSSDSGLRVRSGYPSAELLSDRFGKATLELALKGPAIDLPPIFHIAFDPFLFCDAAYAGRGEAIAPRLVDAAGLGITIGFESPVFVWLDIAYGWNLEGRGALSIYTRARP